MLVIGIDPGLTGAIAFLPDGREPWVIDMPTMPIGKADKRAFDPAATAHLLRSHAVESVSWTPKCAHAFLERVNAFPGQGVTSMFSLGCSYWGAYSVCAALGIPVTLAEPKAWKMFFKLEKDKNVARGLAQKLFPGVELKLVKHHGRAEALLIAQYGKSILGAT